MIQIIITAICAALFFNTIHNLHVKWRINFKPFSCSSCLASWVALLLYVSPQLVVDIASVLFIAGCLTPIIELAMNKLWT